MSEKFLLLLGGEILIPEEDYTSFANQKGKFIKLSGRQLRQLHIFQNGANAFCQVSRFGSRKKVWFLWISEARTVLWRNKLFMRRIRWNPGFNFRVKFLAE